MQYINQNILCLTYEEFVPIISSESNYKQMKLRGNITVHGRGGNGSYILIEFESMPQKYKDAVRAKYGNPYEYVIKQRVLGQVTVDLTAHAYYFNYVLPKSGKNLPNEAVDRYTLAASWLGMLHRFGTDKKAIKKELKLESVDAFWKLAGEMAQIQKVAIPYNVRRLKEKVKLYAGDNYDSLIEAWRFDNDYRDKKGEDGDALLTELMANELQIDFAMVRKLYNAWAQKNSKEPLSESAVYHHYTKNKHLITAQREGIQVSYNKYTKQIKRKRPSQPLLLINGDDNVWDVFYQDGKNKHYRPVLYVIIDAYNDYPLGYAVGETVTKELIYEAFRNAVQHIEELTGDSHIWHQLQTDRWGIGKKNSEKQSTTPSELAQYYTVGDGVKFTPATLKVANAKYIERSFGTLWHQLLKLMAGVNYAGNNITAKSKLNPDMAQKALQKRRDISEVQGDVDKFFTLLRQYRKTEDTPSMQEKWLEGWANRNEAKVKVIDTASKLKLLGVQHKYTNKITSKGLMLHVNGAAYHFDLPQKFIHRYNGLSVNTYYFPEAMDEVLISHENGLRYVARQMELLPSALADFEEGDRERLNRALEEKKEVGVTIAAARERRQKILERAQIDAASVIQGGVQIKGITHAAQKMIQGVVGKIAEDVDYTDVKKEPQTKDKEYDMINIYFDND